MLLALGTSLGNEQLTHMYLKWNQEQLAAINRPVYRLVSLVGLVSELVLIALAGPSEAEPAGFVVLAAGLVGFFALSATMPTIQLRIWVGMSALTYLFCAYSALEIPLKLSDDWGSALAVCFGSNLMLVLIGGLPFACTVFLSTANVCIYTSVGASKDEADGVVVAHAAIVLASSLFAAGFMDFQRRTHFLLTRSLTDANVPPPDVDVRSEALNRLLGSPARWALEEADIRIVDRIGSGRTADVYSGRFNGEEVAVKIMFHSALADRSGRYDFADDLVRAIELLHSIRHRNVLKLHGAVVALPRLLLVTQFCSRGSMHELVEGNDAAVDWALRSNMALDAALGMRCLHSHSVVHGELKSSNLLLSTTYNVSVADAEVARWVRLASNASALAATNGASMPGSRGDGARLAQYPMWVAPEVLRGEPRTQESDVYSFGICMWELMAWEAPFKGCHPANVQLLVGMELRTPETAPRQPGLPPSEAESHARAPPAYRELFRRCWANPDKRPAFEEVVRVLRSIDQRGARYAQFTQGDGSSPAGAGSPALGERAATMPASITPRGLRLSRASSPGGPGSARNSPPSLSRSLVQRVLPGRRNRRAVAPLRDSSFSERGNDADVSWRSSADDELSSSAHEWHSSVYRMAAAQQKQAQAVLREELRVASASGSPSSGQASRSISSGSSGHGVQQVADDAAQAVAEEEEAAAAWAAEAEAERAAVARAEARAQEAAAAAAATAALGPSSSSAPPPPARLQSDDDVEIAPEWLVDPVEVEFGPVIGSGTTGEVYKAAWRGREVAVKNMGQSGTDPRQLVKHLHKEMRLMATIAHENVVTALGVIVTPPLMCLLTEYMANGPLSRWLYEPRFPMSWLFRVNVALDVARGMAFLHARSPPVLHRDLKSPNLLVSEDWVVKIADFGFSRLRSTKPMSKVGTPAWVAPEMMLGLAYNEKVDVYSFAVVLWELIVRQEPYADHEDVLDLMVKITQQHLRPSLEPLPSFSQDRRDIVRGRLQALIVRAWSPNPAERPSFRELVDHLFDIKSIAAMDPSTSDDGTLSPGDAATAMAAAAAAAATAVAGPSAASNAAAAGGRVHPDPPQPAASEDIRAPSPVERTTSADSLAALEEVLEEMGGELPPV